MFTPYFRPRRLRKNPSLRSMISETNLEIDDFILPLFVKHGKGIKKPISSLPGHFQLSVDMLKSEVREIAKLQIPAVLLFGIPKNKDNIGSDAYKKQSVINQAIQAIKQVEEKLIVITDECLCEYTDHGHCGPIINGVVDNDKTLELLARQAVSHAEAGADIVAPSGMMDGMVRAIREALDQDGFEDTVIMSYSTKYASSFYGPFRQAAEGAPKFGDRKSHQMDPANWREAIKETELDIKEGADILMVKPALPYLDIIRTIKNKFPYPLAAYNVSGEFAMVKAAGKMGWIDEKKVIWEVLTSIKRAGANLIITYFAKEAARLIKEAKLPL